LVVQASRERRAGESPDQTQTLSSVTEGQNPGINPTSLGEDTLPDYL
jgi:hypothetical protein